MSSAELPVQVRHEGGVSTITFSRPEVLNAIDLPTARALAGIAAQIGEWSTRVIVLRGAGAAFVAGGDIGAFEPGQAMLEGLGEILGCFHSFVLALARAPQIVVAAVHGAAAGGGLSLVLGCDVSIVREDAPLDFAYRRLGASGDGGCSWWLSQQAGQARALDLLLLRRRFSPAQAQAAGLVTRAVPAEQFEAQVQEVVRTLLENSRGASAEVKRLIRGDLAPLQARLDSEREAFLRCAADPDFTEGVRAFRERRAPCFSSSGDRP